jgi:hypothetical protein
MMADHFVIDGSNLATEGRTEPSLDQLEDAVRSFKAEQPDGLVTVVVDASFEHRIDPKETKAFGKLEAAGEVVSPPAGAVGRGDGFVLQIADRTGGTVVSNDSFQEFHADYRWLFDTGRLIGGKPVPGVGWIFSLRKPVRGPVSRKVVEQGKKAAREEKAAKAVKQAIAEAKEEAMGTSARSKPRRRGGRHGSSSPPEAVNEPAPFLQFVIDHRLGTAIVGTVDAFTSHGAFVMVDGMRCYVPISALGNPPPSRARDVLRRGETREFVVQAVDAPRRGIELGLPGFSNIAGTPTDETVAAEVARSKPKRASAKATAAEAAKMPKTPAKKVSKSAAKKTVKKAGKRAVVKKTAKQPTENSARAKTPPKAAVKKPSATKKSTATKPAKKKAGAKTAKRPSS